MLRYPKTSMVGALGTGLVGGGYFISQQLKALDETLNDIKKTKDDALAAKGAEFIFLPMDKLRLMAKPSVGELARH